MSDSTTKICSKCQQEFPATLEYFHRTKQNGDGLVSCCKVCACERARQWHNTNIDRAHDNARQWRQNNPDKRRASRKRYNEKNRDRKCEYQKRYYEANKDKVREKNRRYRNCNAEKIREKKQLYNRTNRDKGQAWVNRRRALKLAASGTCTAEDIHLQLQNQTDRKGIARCWWCNEPLGDDQSIDHRIPLSRGGSNDARNICVVHLKCNLRKHNKLPHEWNGRLL